MDDLRSAYFTEMRFYRDDPRTTTVMWYRVPETRKRLPFPTPFTSWNWCNNNRPGEGMALGSFGQGEVYGEQRPYWGGEDLNATIYTGDFCGTKEEWSGAALITPPPDTIPPTPPACVCRHGFRFCTKLFPLGGAPLRLSFDAAGQGVHYPPFLFLPLTEPLVGPWEVNAFQLTDCQWTKTTGTPTSVVVWTFFLFGHNAKLVMQCPPGSLGTINVRYTVPRKTVREWDFRSGLPLTVVKEYNDPLALGWPSTIDLFGHEA